MNYETTKVRMPSVLINKKDIFYIEIYAQHYLIYFKFQQSKNLEQSRIKRFLYHKP